MATTSTGESSTGQPKPSGEKPVVVRVKRKSSHSRLDAFWLEINERPWKRQLLDLEKLSISDTAAENRKEELGPRKVLVKHVETVVSSEDAIEIVQSFVTPNPTDVAEGITKIEERRRAFKKHNQQEQLLSKARQSHEELAKSVRFEQIWRSRQGNKAASSDKAVRDMCHFYDVVRVDVEERSSVAQEHEVISLEDQKLLSSYLPLLREFIPSAAAEIESDLHPCLSDQDDYVYDYYTVRDDMDIHEEDASFPFPLVQVEDEEYHDGPDDESEYDSYDSNAESHPRNEYPDESSEEEDDVDEEEDDKEDSEEALTDGSDEEGRYGVNNKSEEHKIQCMLDDSDTLYEDGLYDGDFDDGNDLDYGYDSDDGEGWR